MSQILARKHGAIGHITLDRPEALNALTEEMCVEVTRALQEYADDAEIGAVVIDGAGERAFCAGGDVILLHDSGKAKDDRAENFWRTEYALNEYISRYPKPYIALIDGFVMGGGVGLSVHGRLRVAGDTTRFAMPETGIGYFPDVGGTFFLPRLGSAIGNWLGLTGANIGPGQSCDLGVANAFVPTARHDELIEALADADLDGSDSAVANVMKNFVQRPPEADALPAAISCFDEPTVPAILRALDADGSEWAAKQAKSMRRKSPLALSVTLEAMRRGGKLQFREAMERELDYSLGFLKTQDFYEGIRSQLIDKDRNPKWSHDMDGVTQAQVSRVLARHASTPLEFLP
ncbi:MAG: enoyl-CoA hydratase/isomerase family protein [Litorimonas sp.]